MKNKSQRSRYNTQAADIQKQTFANFLSFPFLFSLYLAIIRPLSVFTVSLIERYRFIWIIYFNCLFLNFFLNVIIGRNKSACGWAGESISTFLWISRTKMISRGSIRFLHNSSFQSQRDIFAHLELKIYSFRQYRFMNFSAKESDDYGPTIFWNILYTFRFSLFRCTLKIYREKSFVSNAREMRNEFSRNQIQDEQSPKMRTSIQSCSRSRSRTRLVTR